jgi:hypothetical protein
MAEYLQAEYFEVAVHYRADLQDLSLAEREAIEGYLNSARHLHVEARRLEGEDVAASLGDFARPTPAELEPIAAIRHPPTKKANGNRGSERPPEGQQEVSHQSHQRKSGPEDFSFHFAYLAMTLRPVFIRVAAAALLACAFACFRSLDAFFLAGLQIECVAFCVLDDVFLQDFSLEALQRTFQAFAIVYLNFSQRSLPLIFSGPTIQSNSFR